MAQRIPPANEDTIQALRQALALARDSRDWHNTSRLAVTLGMIYFERLNLYDARLNMQEAVTMLRFLNDTQKLAEALGYLATVEYYLGNGEEALAFGQEAMQLASASNLL